MMSLLNWVCCPAEAGCQSSVGGDFLALTVRAGCREGETFEKPGWLMEDASSEARLQTEYKKRNGFCQFTSMKRGFKKQMLSIGNPHAVTWP
jgi:hypothetical protein